MGSAGCGGASAPPAVASRGATQPRGASPLAAPLRARLRALPSERRGRLLASPHRAYRLLAAASTRAACDVLEGRRFVVQLHGDLHLGQVVLADGWLGLADLDESVRGPVQVDLLRFAASLRLGGRHLGSGATDRAVRGFLRSYATAVARAQQGELTEPPAFLRARLEREVDAASDAERSEALRARLRPLPDEAREALLRAAAPGCPALRERPEAVGRIEAGVGSAALDKVLLLVATARGPRWLEAKETPPHAEAPCLGSDAREAPDRVLQGLRHFEVGERAVQCAFAFRGRRYTVGRWALRYAELEPERDLRSAEELLAVARWVGERLGVVHGRQLAGRTEREALAAVVARDLEALEAAALRLARALLAALDALRAAER